MMIHLPDALSQRIPPARHRILLYSMKKSQHSTNPERRLKTAKPQPHGRHPNDKILSNTLLEKNFLMLLLPMQHLP